MSFSFPILSPIRAASAERRVSRQRGNFVCSRAPVGEPNCFSAHSLPQGARMIPAYPIASPYNAPCRVRQHSCTILLNREQDIPVLA